MMQTLCRYKWEDHWKSIVTDRAEFQLALMKHLTTGGASFKTYIDSIRRYRNRFVAHLDSDHEMYVPTLDSAKNAVWFYHSYVVTHEAKVGDLAVLAVEHDGGYAVSETEARTVFAMTAKGGRPQRD